MTRWGTTLLALGVMTATASAQSTTWQTVQGGDASGDYVRVELRVREGELRGTRRVARLDAPSGYTTGTSATIVFEGNEPEEQRSLRVHLPYGAALDLAVGDTVEVQARAHRLGLGSRHEVLVTRGGQIVLLTTSSNRVAGIRVARGAEMPREGSRRRYGMRVTMARNTVNVAANQLAYLTRDSLLVSGSEIRYVGRIRPPDAFDSRTLTIVRVRPRA